MIGKSEHELGRSLAVLGKNFVHHSLIARTALSLFALPVAAYAGNIDRVVITGSSLSIESGEPFHVWIQIEYDVHLRHTRSGTIQASVRETLALEITKDGNTDVIEHWGGLPPSLLQLDRSGRRYGAPIWVSYDYSTETLLFSDPGDYTLRVFARKGSVRSNPVHVNVAPCSPATKGALALLLKSPVELKYAPYYAFLCNADEPDLDKIPGARNCLEVVADKHGTSILAQYARVRLGIARLSDLTDGGPRPTAEACRDCYEDLRIGLELPKDSPIRAEALFFLAQGETCAREYDAALEHLDVLAKDFPTWGYKRRASGLRSEIAVLRQRR